MDLLLACLVFLSDWRTSDVLHLPSSPQVPGAVSPVCLNSAATNFYAAVPASASVWLHALRSLIYALLLAYIILSVAVAVLVLNAHL